MTPQEIRESFGKLNSLVEELWTLAVSTARCGACGDAGDLEYVIAWTLNDNTQRAEWQCRDGAACNVRRSPELAALTV